MKKIFYFAIIPTIIIFLISIFISYEDMRPVDGSLTIGYPLKIYTKSSGFIVPETTTILYENLAIMLISSYLIGLFITYAFLNQKK